MNDYQEVSHKSLGLTGNEQRETVKFKTFCNMCRRQVPVGSTAIVMMDEADQQYYIHVDCGLASMTQIHNTFFRQEVKKKPVASSAGRPSKKVRLGDGAGFCNFCGLLTAPDDTYVREGKKRYHHPGKASCWDRYKKTLARTRESLL